ncbi:uncharacterized protein BX663DRAFT_416350, partial [Cokeromyces recurvatus]|uniref:uncharacterized protein n=1 Tax=Cokeromyces recurvatus TaxID=90255 RepID=UPI00221EFA75
ELEHHRKEVEDELQNLRSRAEVCREKRARYEHNYHTVASVPFFASQSKKRYIKARDKNSEIEQQISEKRQTLDKCREHLKLISKAVAAQQAERSQLLTERERSLNALHSSQQQLNELKEGCEFWSNFDSYQAQVVLESAIYLRDLLEGDNTIKEKKKKKKGKKDAASEDNVLDINEVWIKTFRLACFEYGDHELYGDMHWSLTSLQIYFDCGLCEIYQVGWPKMMTLNHITELACELCYSTI